MLVAKVVLAYKKNEEEKVEISSHQEKQDIWVSHNPQKSFP